MALLLLLTHSTGSAQVKADFTSSSAAGCTPLVVQFANTSGGSPTSFFWDFGNGSTSTLQNPGVLYNVPGTYTVKLVASDGAGNADSVIKTNYVTVYAKPVVNFDISPDAGCSPLNVSFTDKSTAASGTEEKWSWDFGDGQVSSVQNPTHTYTTIDTFSVSLTVTNSFGCSNLAQKARVVEVDGVNNVDFDYSYNNACSPPTRVTFSNTTSANSPVTYQWYFGDGGASSQQNPVYTYTANGQYNVQLIVATEQGCRDTVTKSISIGTISPDFTSPPGGCANKSITFQDNSSPTPIFLKWYFGDGTTSAGVKVSHTYSSPGSYNVKLLANFGSCTDSITKVFIVADKPVPSFTSTDNRATCTVPSTIQFQNTTQNGASYVWQFGDGVKSTLASPSHTYSKAGFYNVTLIAANSNGCSDTLVETKYVQVGPPRIDSLSNSPLSGCVNSPLSFNAAVSSGDPISSYNWSFGDGAVSSAASPTHQYASAGSYNVTLKVTTNSGCTDSLKFAYPVNIGNHPTAKFSASPTDACASSPIKFTDKSIGKITSWTWNFGDKYGDTTAQNPSHWYADTGLFTISLIVSSNGCYDSTKMVNYVHINAPIANFGYTYSCRSKLTRNFTDSSIGAQSWAWDFGDDSTSSSQNVSHIYKAAGTYYVKLTVTNSTCSSTKIDTINVVNNGVSFTFNPAVTTFCKYDSVRFNANYNPSQISTFYWNFGDGINSGFGQQYSTISHRYTRSGNYTPMLVAEDILGCRDTAISNVKFAVYGPKANFSNIGGTCVNDTIKFVDMSTPDAVPHPIQKWIWDYGDGTVKTLTINDTPYTHVYTATGIYAVKLKVVDQYGCYDTALHTAADTITHPVANFTALDSIRCSVSPVNFIDSSQGISLAYVWNFGDNQTSAIPSPQHLYGKTGTYSVSLHITDRFGCQASITKNNFIRISNPRAVISIADTAHYCPPWIVNPVSNSTGYTFLTWKFGDGNSSNIAKPQHSYVTAGVYNLLLIAQGHGGCYDTAQKKLTLLGPSGTLTYSSNAICTPGKVSFSATGKDVAAYNWVFGDGQSQATTAPSFNYTYKIAGIYLPSLTIIDSLGNCQVQLQNAGDSIRVADVKANFGATTAPGCDSALVSFTDSSQIYFDALQSIQWKFGDGDSSGAVNPQHYYSTSGNRTVTLNVTTNTGCTSTYKLPVDVVVHQSPVVNAVIPAAVCVNTSAGFTASNNSPQAGALQWLWQFGDGGTDTLRNTSYTYTTANTYTVSVTATNEFGCADTVQSNITVQPLPAVDAGIDSTICLGAPVTLQPSGANTYVWASSNTLSCTNCTNPVATPDSTTTYYVAGTSAAGCVNIDSVTVTVKQRTTLVLQPPVDTLCAGNSLQLNASGAEVYNWQPATGLSSTVIANPVASPATTTTYTLIGNDTKKCFFDTATVVVEVFPNPSVSFADTGVTIMEGDHYTMVSTTSPDVITWLWLPPAGLSCNNCAQPVAAPRLTTKYTKTVYNQYGCSATASFDVVVLCNEQSLFIPNTFSPNGDGVNDYFYPRGPNIYSIKSMRVFNRWGQVVFYRLNIKANDAANAWDGTYNGKAQPSDVYVYSIEVICDNGTILSQKGNVTLLR